MGNYKEQLSQQLLALSQAIPTLDDESLCTGMLDTCSGLMAVLCAHLPTDNLDIDSAEDIASCLDDLQTQMNRLATATSSAACLQVSTDNIRLMQEQVQLTQALTQREQAAKTALPGLTAQNNALAVTVDGLEAAYTLQMELHNTLLNQQEEYSDTKRQELENTNNVLMTQIAQKKQRIVQLEQARAENDLALQALQAQIDTMPDEQQLVAAYDEKKTYLDRLTRANVECSLQKQNEVSNQIYELEKSVRKLEADMGILQRRKAELESAKTQVQTQQGQFETDFIEKLRGAMDDLKSIMTNHRQALNQLKDDADALQESIDQCNVIYQNYRFLFHSIHDPLEAIAKASDIEYENLKKYLDIRVSDKISGLKANIERDLGELGNIIDSCREAVSLDQQNLHHKVFVAG